MGGCFPVSMIEIDEILFLSGLCGIVDKGLFLSSFKFLFCFSFIFWIGLFALKVGVDFWFIKVLWLVVGNLFGAFLSLVFLAFFVVTELDWLVTNCPLDPGWVDVLVVVVLVVTSPLVYDLRPELSWPPLIVVVVFVVVTCALLTWLCWFGWFLWFVVLVILLWFPRLGLFFWFIDVILFVVNCSLVWLLRPEDTSFWILLVLLTTSLFPDLNPWLVDVVFVVVVVFTISFFPLRLSFLLFPLLTLVVVVVVVSVVFVNLENLPPFWFGELSLLVFLPLNPELCDSFVISIWVVLITFLDFPPDSFLLSSFFSLDLENFPSEEASLLPDRIFDIFLIVISSPLAPPPLPPFFIIVSFL